MEYGTITLGTPITINSSCHSIALRLAQEGSIGYTQMQALLSYNVNLRLYDVNGRETEIFDNSLLELVSMSGFGNNKAIAVSDLALIFTIPFSSMDFKLVEREELKLTVSKAQTTANIPLSLTLNQMPTLGREGLFLYRPTNIPQTAINHLEDVRNSSAVYIEDSSKIKSITMTFANGREIKYAKQELIDISNELRPKWLKYGDIDEEGYMYQNTTEYWGNNIIVPANGVNTLDIESSDVSGQKMYKLEKPQ